MATEADCFRLCLLGYYYTIHDIVLCEEAKCATQMRCFDEVRPARLFPNMAFDGHRSLMLWLQSRIFNEEKVLTDRLYRQEASGLCDEAIGGRRIALQF